jgi:hypothetical protein
LGGTLVAVTEEEKRVREKFADVGYFSGGEFYVPAHVSLSFLDVCAGELLAVVGIEVFSRCEERLRPNLDLIADFSEIVNTTGPWKKIVGDSLEEARAFLANVPPELEPWINFTLLSAGDAPR